MGGQISTDIKDCTHLVLNKVRSNSWLLLAAINRGVYILNERWLDESYKAKMFLNPATYPLTDPHAEKQMKFTLQTSLSKARSAPLFDGWRFYLEKYEKSEAGDDDNEMSRENVRTIIECGNGQVLSELPTVGENETEKKVFDKLCIVYSDETKAKEDEANVSSVIFRVALDSLLEEVLKQKF